MIRDAKQVLTELLVLQAQRGSERAFRDLHDLWQGDLRRMVLVRLERPDAADDVLTDVWLAIARALPLLDDPACFPRWAFQIVQRRTADWVRRRVTERRHEDAATAEPDLLALQPMAAAEPGDDAFALRDAISRLPADDRALLHLHYDAERSLQEIADVLHLPVGTIKSRLFTIREHLKQQLKGQRQ
jgi:RNA polymerase sigma factor (sigma-70 family)